MTAVAQVLAAVPRLFVWILSKRTLRNREREVFLRVVRPGMTVFDIGANVGDYTRLFSVLVRSRGTVHAFEPIPQSYQRLTACVSGLANVRLHPIAVAERSATMEMTVMAGDFGQASLAAPDPTAGRASTPRQTFQVPVMSLDELLAQGSVTPPDVIKIDVEGAERMVLRGASALIAAHRPVLFFELFARWTSRFGYTPLDLLRDVEALGYTEGYVLGTRLRPLPALGDMAEWPHGGSVNILALPPTALGGATRARIAPLLAETQKTEGSPP